MANSRIFYALQQVVVNGTALRGVQSVGTSSTTNIESFSAFGSTDAISKLQDLDLEITVENALGDGWTNGLNAFGFGGLNSTLDDSKTITIEYLTASGTTSTIELDAVLTGYSMQMGVDGPATESLTFQNAGTAVFTAGNAGSALSAGTGSLCKVITRPDFTSFSYTPYSDCCAGTAGTQDTKPKVISCSTSWDAGNEKISILGRSLPFGKFATFPIETSMEVEYHLDPSSGIGDFNSGTVTNNTLDDVCYDVSISLPSNTFTIAKARQTSVSRSGGDVGGGNVSISESYTGYNSFSVS